MAMQAAKMNKEETLGGTGSELAQKVTWPSKEDVLSTTGVVIATVAFFAAFLRIVDWFVEKGVTELFKVFGV